MNYGTVTVFSISRVYGRSYPYDMSMEEASTQLSQIILSASPPCDGKRSVSFVCNGHAYSIELNSYGDWFNTDMFDFMDHVLEKENCPFKLYEFPAHMQFVIMLYCSETQQEKIAPLIDEF